jgi:transposase
MEISLMSNKVRDKQKEKYLKEQGTLNPRPEAVQDELFQSSTFFDPKDLVQVKYEMLRRVETDGESVLKTSSKFGFSRPSFYKAQKAFAQHGLAGLVPKKTGPRSAHKLTDEIMDFLQQIHTQDEAIDANSMAQLVLERFGISVHPRSIERAFARRKKKQR